MNIIYEILHGPWLLTAEAQREFFPLAHALISGNTITPQMYNGRKKDEDQPQVKFCYLEDDDIYEDDDEYVEEPSSTGAIAVVPIKGIMTKYGSSMSYGIRDIENILMSLDMNEKVDAIITVYDTPGGSASAAISGADTIKNIKKPVLAFVDKAGMCCSGGMMMSSYSDEIWAGHNMSYLGSIGTMTTYVNYAKAYKKVGIDVKELYARKSTKKNYESRELEKGNEGPILDSLDEMNEFFHAVMLEGREGKIVTEGNDVLKGAVFSAEKALSFGLIDNIGTFEASIKRARELADNRKTTLKIT